MGARGVDRRIVKKHKDSGDLLNSKIGLVYIQDKAADKKSRAMQVQVLDANKNLIEVCASVRSTGIKYGISASSITTSYLDKDRLCRNKYYFVSAVPSIS